MMPKTNDDSTGSSSSVEVRSGEANEDYHADKAFLSSSPIRDYIKGGPAYFHRRHIARIDSPPTTEAQSKGTLTHLLMELGRDTFGARSRLIPNDYCTAGGALSAKADAKQWVVDQGPDAILLTPADSLFLEEVLSQFDQNKAVTELYEKIQHREISIRWQTTEGYKLKCRPDAVTSDGIGIDYKTTKLQNPKDDFWLACRDWGYHISGALYEQGLVQAGLSDQPLNYIVISTTSPYLVQAVTIPRRLVDLGRKKLERAIADIHARTSFDHWVPEAYDSVEECVVPKWFYRQEEE